MTAYGEELLDEDPGAVRKSFSDLAKTSGMNQFGVY
jgi:hypothetical protein